MYATRDDMVKAFGEKECIALTDRSYKGVIDDGVLVPALEQASAEIDGYLCGRYPVPWPDEPRVLVGKCCNIVRYLLCGADTQMTPEIRERYEDTLRYLEKVAAGRITLGRSSTGEVVRSGTGARMVSGGRVFGRDQTGGGGF
ncbi:phage protein Gp36 family protein [Cedecea neteri]|uniref:gp436 family protein n=1 Tax=Cedecea neteri TaxID=158822 RepID=UPI002AA8B2E3|nr:phage protein Gp36 family protein [Cedecea neteri]WPU22568.1 phage protein Gp36 family protein [Cedecea neteri]